MEELYLYIGLLILLSFVLVILTFLKKRTTHTTEAVQNEGAAAEVRPRPLRQNVENADGIGGIRNRAAANRNARARMRAAQAQRQLQDSDVEDDVEEFEEETVLPEGKIGKKKMAKIQMKAEKKAMREAEERDREEKKEREEQRAERRRQLEKEEEEEEARKEEEERKKREEQERKEQEEYEAMKKSFEVAEEGFDDNIDEEKQRDLLKEFVDYIKKNKVVVLEDLAALFKLKTQAVINRITELQKNGTLTGVIDDRGKFIYICQAELDSVAKFIRQRGRVTLSDIAEASNTLINLNPETVVQS